VKADRSLWAVLFEVGRNPAQLYGHDLSPYFDDNGFYHWIKLPAKLNRAWRDGRKNFIDAERRRMKISDAWVV
jgi:hypothetical protein